MYEHQTYFCYFCTKRNFLYRDQTSPVERPTRKATCCSWIAFGWFRVIFKNDDQKIVEVTIVWVSIFCRSVPANCTNICTNRVCTLESKIKMTSIELKTGTWCSPLIMLSTNWLRHRFLQYIIPLVQLKLLCHLQQRQWASQKWKFCEPDVKCSVRNVYVCMSAFASSDHEWLTLKVQVSNAENSQCHS